MPVGVRSDERQHPPSRHFTVGRNRSVRVPLPPISNELQLEDADGDEYSVSGEETSRLKNAKPNVAAPTRRPTRPSKASSFSIFGDTSTNKRVLSAAKSNTTEKKPEQSIISQYPPQPLNHVVLNQKVSEETERRKSPHASDDASRANGRASQPFGKSRPAEAPIDVTNKSSTRFDIAAPVANREKKPRQLQSKTTYSCACRKKEDFKTFRSRLPPRVQQEEPGVEIWFCNNEQEGGNSSESASHVQSDIPVEECAKADIGIETLQGTPALDKSPESMEFTESSHEPREAVNADIDASAAQSPPITLLDSSVYHIDSEVLPEDVFVTGLSLSTKAFRSSPISIQKAIGLKKVLFGDVGGCWSKSWLSHPLTFHESVCFSVLHFSPSGVLAALQAYFLSQVFFSQAGSECVDKSKLWNCSDRVKLDALARGLSALLWKSASAENRAYFCSVSKEAYYRSGAAIGHDGITERIDVFEFDNQSDLTEFLVINIARLTCHKCLLIMVLYSVVLSRGLYAVRQDMVRGDLTLLKNSKCTKSLISLLITGVASPSWLNDSRDLRDAEKTRGIQARSDIGLLTRADSAKTPVVGSNLKTPKLPVWLAESSAGAYSVLFCSVRKLMGDWKAEMRFELHWMLSYPGTTASHPVLTLDSHEPIRPGERSEEDFPPIELVIRTKWRDVGINWNGSDPAHHGFQMPSEATVLQ